MLIDPTVWADQIKFNRELRAAHGEFATKDQLVKEIVLHLISECDELLRTTDWKPHRRTLFRPNERHSLDELIDIFKLWLTIVQGLDFSPEQVWEAYWRKTMVVRQRFSEEWVTQVVGPVALLDIDGVLCDYVLGMIHFLQVTRPELVSHCEEGSPLPAWVDHQWAGVPPEEWETIKHQFRRSGYKRGLPVMPGAHEFIECLSKHGYQPVLLTSRPIDQYPTLYGDTLQWVEMAFGRTFPIWWAASKADAIVIRQARSVVAFAVDDDPNFVIQLSKIGIRSYWFRPRESVADAQYVRSFREILKQEGLL